MHWISAGRIIFWITLLLTLGWAAFGKPLLAVAFFFIGLAFTAEAFVAAKAEDVFPRGFGTPSFSLGFFSCTVEGKSTNNLFDRISIKVDAKNRALPFSVTAHAKKAVWKGKEKAVKNKKALEKIVGLVEVDLKEQQARITLEDEPNVKKTIEDTLRVLKKIWA